MKFRNIYIHFPFCETKCHYCDFFSLPEKQIASGERSRIYRAIETELSLFEPQLGDQIDTVFLGGGTPSLVPYEHMDALLSRLLGSRTTNATEVTIEANPSSISSENAKQWLKMGINRVSMGVQALDDHRLEWLGRVHSKQKAFDALNILHETGFKNISIDYIVGVPDQSTEQIELELSDVLSCFPNIKHLSAYLLTLKTANSKYKELPSDDIQLAHLQKVSAVLGDHGFEQYEISNFARNGARALHNENYWLGGSYLGIGPSAHSYRSEGTTETRTKNWASLGKYCDLIESGRPSIEWSESLTDEQRRLEYLMLRLRRKDGILRAEYQSRFNRNIVVENQGWIDIWEKKGLCKTSPERLQLTRDGFFLSDQILSNIN